MSSTKFEHWNQSFDQMLQTATCRCADIMLGHSKKRYIQVNAAFKKIESWTFDTKPNSHKRMATKLLSCITNEMYKTKCQKKISQQ